MCERETERSVFATNVDQARCSYEFELPRARLDSHASATRPLLTNAQLVTLLHDERRDVKRHVFERFQVFFDGLHVFCVQRNNKHIEAWRIQKRTSERHAQQTRTHTMVHHTSISLCNDGVVHVAAALDRLQNRLQVWFVAVLAPFHKHGTHRRPSIKAIEF